MDETRRFLFERHAAICQVFSHHLRLELLDALRDGELTVGELAKRTRAGASNVSQHVSLMRERGALESRREGSRVYYRVADPRIFVAFDLMRELLLDQIRAQGALADTSPEGPRSSRSRRRPVEASSLPAGARQVGVTDGSGPPGGPTARRGEHAIPADHQHDRD